MWTGSIPNADLRNPQARETAAVLAALSRAGFITTTRTPTATHYYLTPRAFPYYYASQMYGNNRDAPPYLCYTELSPTRVIWAQHPHPEPFGPHHRLRQTFHAAFEWIPSSPPSWARDPIIASHSVYLPPTTSPTIAKLVLINNEWLVVNIYTPSLMLPSLANKNEWPSDDKAVGRGAAISRNL